MMEQVEGGPHPAKDRVHPECGFIWILQMKSVKLKRGHR